ncbi:MAG: hypothetical protein ACKO3W_08015 [bacterium]
MSTTPDRNHPHLRLTAAIVVAGFVAILAAFGGNEASSERARRAEANALAAQGLLHGYPNALLALGVLSTPADLPAHLQFGHLVRPNNHGSAEGLGEQAASDAAIARAERRLRLDASGPDRAARLRTTVLPPPIA